MRQRSTTIANGAALALLDKQLVTSRVLRRSYGVSWDVEAEDIPKTLHGSARIAVDEFDKRRRLLDLSKFLFKIVGIVVSGAPTLKWRLLTHA